MSVYQQRSLEGASGVQLIVALYDGIIRFLYKAIDGVESNNVHARRAASKRALDIIIHLQARLRMDVGGEPAVALADFYAAMFGLILQASQSASRERYLHVIHCVQDVRDAWRQAAKSESAGGIPQVADIVRHSTLDPNKQSKAWMA